MAAATINPQAFPSGSPADADDTTVFSGRSDATGTLGSIEHLHTLYAPRVFRYLLASSRDRDVAETLTQETFLRAWTARDQFRGDCTASTWLLRIAINLLRDHTRSSRFRFWQRAGRTAEDARDVDLAGRLPHRVSTAEAGLIAHEQVVRVWSIVATLSERQRTVFLLRFVEELELPEIAAATGLPVSTVKTHLYRGLAIVRSRHAQPAAANTKETR